METPEPAGAAQHSVLKLEAMFEKAAHARKPQDIEWVLDAAFFVGLQYTAWNAKAKRFEEIARPTNKPNAPRPIANKIYSLAMDSYASAKAQDPAVEVQATSSDAIDVSNAKIAQAWVDYITGPTESAWLSRRNQALFWVSLCGEGWLKWTIDGKTQKPRIEACSPLEVYCDPAPASYLDARWIIHVRGMDPEDVYDRFGIELEASDLDSKDVLKEQILRQIGMVNGSPTVTVKELWELPSRRHPKGRHVIWAASRVLFYEDFPYTHGMLPFTQIGHSPIPGTKHFMSGVRIARPIQMEMNQYHAQKTTSRKRFANHKWFMDAALSETLTAPIDDSEDQVLIADTQAGRLNPPTILQAQMWPDSQDGEWLNEELGNAMGLHEASQGQAPGRVDSATGIEALQEADKGRLSEVRDTLVVAMARGFGMMIQLAKQFIDAEQIVPVYARNGAVQVRKFKTDIFPDQPMLKVVSGGGLPTNRTARRAEVMTMWSAGLLGENPARALEMLDYPRDMHLSPDELDELEAYAENLLMLDGQAATPKPWQNHEIHRRVHDECRKSAEFASATDDVWGLFEFHEAATDTAELDEMRQEAERQRSITTMLEEVNPPEPDPAAGMPGAELPPAPAEAAAPAPATPDQPQP